MHLNAPLSHAHTHCSSKVKHTVMMSEPEWMFVVVVCAPVSFRDNLRQQVAFKGAILISYLCLIYVPNDCHNNKEMECPKRKQTILLLPVKITWLVTKHAFLLTFWLCEIKPKQVETHRDCQIINLFQQKQMNYRCNNVLTLFDIRTGRNSVVSYSTFYCLK